MLTVFYGTDTERARAEARAYLAQDGRPPEWIIATEWYPGRCTECAETMPLFGDPKLFVLDVPTQHEAFSEEVFAGLSTFATSPHTFVLVEEGLPAVRVKAVQASASGGVFEYAKTRKEESFNTFALADALAAKDKRKLWTLLLAAYAAGQVPEAIAGVLIWQLKSLILASRTKHASEADMKDFTYNKAKRALANFKAGEVEELLRDLVRTRHEGHSGTYTLEEGLERWVLRIA